LFNKMWKYKHLVPNYMHVNVNGNN
jgi:hypothetical protein